MEGRARSACRQSRHLYFPRHTMDTPSSRHSLISVHTIRLAFRAVKQVRSLGSCQEQAAFRPQEPRVVGLVHGALQLNERLASLHLLWFDRVSPGGTRARSATIIRLVESYRVFERALSERGWS